MALTTTQIKTHARQAAREQLANPQPIYVEVTHGDGTVEVLSVDDYNRLTSTDTAHRGLRMISAAEAQLHPRRKGSA